MGCPACVPRRGPDRPDRSTPRGWRCHNRPARRALTAAGQREPEFIAGQVSFLVLTQIEAAKVPFPSFADVLNLLTYPLYAAGLLTFIWWRPDRDRRSLIDALTLTVGLALLSWIYLILPYVHNPALSWLQKSVAIAYPLGDVLVLAMLARLLAAGTVRTRSVQLLALGSAALLVSDVSFVLILLYGTFRNGTIVDLGWAVFYAAWGAAALHPTMSELTQPSHRAGRTRRSASWCLCSRPLSLPLCCSSSRSGTSIGMIA